MKYTTIIFDFDGVIVDSWRGIANGFVKCLSAYGIHETEEEVKKMIGPPFAHLICKKYGLSEEEGRKAIMIHRKYYREHGVYEAELYEGVKETLKLLHDNGVRLAIASTKPLDNIICQCEYFGIIDFIEFIDGQDDFQTRGTKTVLVRETMDMMDVREPERTLMVGDKITDIVAGRDNGCDTALVTYGYGNEHDYNESHPTWMIDSPYDLVDLVFSGEKEK